MEKKSYVYLNAFLAKDEFKDEDFDYFIKKESPVRTYNIDDKHHVTGTLFVKIPKENKPKWYNIVEDIVGTEIDELINRSSSAVLIIKTNNKVFAFTFGYGRFLLNLAYFVQDFGLKTALNTLNHDSLRSVDLYTFDDQAVQKKAQATRNSEARTFGIDISKDVLRAVTGSPKSGIVYQNISGGDAIFSFGKKMKPNELPLIAEDLYLHYSNESYKDSFSWVDNIRKLKDKSLIENLDKTLARDVENKNQNFVVTIPEIIQWDNIYGFSFTRAKNIINPTLETSDYLNTIGQGVAITVDSLKRDKLFVFDIYDNETDYQLYKCLYYEVSHNDKTHVLFNGVWYEIDNNFINRIDQTLGQIELSGLHFPKVYTWIDEDKIKIESEGNWNERAADENGYYLLDKRLIKCNRTTSPIELCDLLTSDKQFIHVKHRKGGSAGLSHLFAQGSVSAEILLGDRDFRKETRKVLRRVSTDLSGLIPIDGLKSDDFEIVYLILGDKSSKVIENLPFFSKINLSKSYESLTQRGFKVSICGTELEEK